MQPCLTAHDGDEKPSYRATGVFFVVTPSGTPVYFRLGVESLEATQVGLKPIDDEHELIPKGLFKGRRFAIKLLQESEPQK